MVKTKRPTENIEKGTPENNNIVDTASTIDRTDDSSQFTTTNSSYPSPEIVQIIPVVEEDFDVTKKTVIHEATIAKRLATKTEKIEIPLAYEEVYINNKKLKIYDKEEEGLLSRIKDTIAHSVSASDEDNDIEYHYPPSFPIEPSRNGSKRDSNQKNHDSNFSMKGEAIPLIEGREKSETEKIVPIWGEEIIVRKRKVKLGEIVIRKRRIIENKKIDIGIKKEKVSVEYPDGLKQELTQ